VRLTIDVVSHSSDMLSEPTCRFEEPRVSPRLFRGRGDPHRGDPHSRTHTGLGLGLGLGLELRVRVRVKGWVKGWVNPNPNPNPRCFSRQNVCVKKGVFV